MDVNEFGVPKAVERIFLDWAAEYVREHPGKTSEEIAAAFLEYQRQLG